MNDDDIERILDQNPLLTFSLYTQSQADTLGRIGREVIGLTNAWDPDHPIADFPRVYDLFWLWVLGAYEMVRTMDQHSDHFSDALRARLRRVTATV